MKYIILTLTLVICNVLSAQLVATVELKEKVEGTCGETVYALFPGFKGQVGPVCP